MKRWIGMILACLMLLTLLPVAVFAAGGSALNFELTAEGGTSVGSILTVTFRILRTDSSGDYRLNAMQNEIEYDKGCFELVPDSIQLQRGGYAAARADERTDGTKIIVVNDMLADYASSETICSFRLKVIGTNGTVRSSNAMAFSNDAENPKKNLVRDASSNVTIGGGSQYNDKIHVTMRLIGAEQAEKDVDLGSVKYLPDYVTWLPTTTYDLNKGSSVYDLWVMATDAAGIRSVGANRNYVSTVYAPDSLGGYALSQFSNGERSGWMYTINGNHPGLGLKEQDLEDEDVVIWHYVNDYSYEVEDWFNDGQWQALGDGTYYNRWLMALNYFGGKGGGYMPETESGDATAPADDVLTPKATEKDGTATASVDVSDMDKAVENAKKNKSDALTIAPEITGTTSEASVQLPKSSVSEMATGTDADLKVATPVGDVTIPNQALNSVADSAEGSDVVVNIAKKSVSDVDDKNIDTSSGIVISVTITSGGKHITSFGGESITIDIPVEGDYTVGETYNVVQISGNGSQQLLTGTCIKKDGKLFVRVITSHLSTFVLLDGMAVPFIDMDGHWALNGIRYAFGKNVMTGVASDKFDPEGTFSRAMLATMLYRLEGRPSVSGMNNPFSDVANGQWYTDAIIWAAKNNIVNGYGGGLFGPSDDISREQMATMLLRYSKYKKYDTSKKGSLAAFADAKNISTWALDGMKWANAEGLVTGHTASLLAPAGTATRAEAATLLMRFMTNVVR